METKFCPRCERDVPITEFAPNKSKRDGLCAYCIPCRQEYNRSYYKRTPEKNPARVAAKKRGVAAARAYVDAHLAENVCVDCGEADPIVLDFDHVRGEKHLDISLMIARAYSIPKLEAEIAKCDVRCANCHRRVTAVRQGWRAKTA